MPRPTRKLKLPPPIRPIVRVACSVCRRTWAVYEGFFPRRWAVHEGAVVCDRPSCRKATGAAPPVGRRSALNR